MKVVIRKINELNKKTREVLKIYLENLPEDFQEMSWKEYTETQGLYGVEQYVVQPYTAYFWIKGKLFIKRQSNDQPFVRITNPEILPSYFPLHDED